MDVFLVLWKFFFQCGKSYCQKSRNFMTWKKNSRYLASRTGFGGTPGQRFWTAIKPGLSWGPPGMKTTRTLFTVVHRCRMMLTYVQVVCYCFLQWIVRRRVEDTGTVDRPVAFFLRFAVCSSVCRTRWYMFSDCKAKCVYVCCTVRADSTFGHTARVQKGLVSSR